MGFEHIAVLRFEVTIASLRIVVCNNISCANHLTCGPITECWLPHAKIPNRSTSLRMALAAALMAVGLLLLHHVFILHGYNMG